MQDPVREIAPTQYSKLHLAHAHFDAACKAFLSDGHPAVVITLAGVAEEIYGQALLQGFGVVGDHPAPRFVDEIVRFGAEKGDSRNEQQIKQFLYEAKNGVKHARDIKEMVSIEPAHAWNLLLGAMMNRNRIGIEIQGDAAEVARRIASALGRLDDLDGVL
ncbi:MULTISPECIES: hypothetical protein [Stenotrophomonas]|uniref:hypothetical protein n=1 Tax=Stenotrophomonas TaxID=40323 RepID=UPI000C145757|nr:MULTISPECIES: hypothetical protein [Stenotrophomonas]MBH1383220.1 hypothetical protein [Stenotrophomonas maltophilia]MBN5103699.1 hypothetical protein [Stenotrophomonas maltophilia]MCM2521623.1 hypothetical protein [Stenotrophomonas maltophilia]MDQ7306098.1 hypothetical protein [Stenotrophomonas sp. Sm3119]HDX0800493.1 hypothetical protein [Stenotrophomonas maltophilia]